MCRLSIAKPKRGRGLPEIIGEWFDRQRHRPAAPSYAWVLTFLLGLATAFFAAILLQLFPQDSHAMPPGFGSPVLAFEMARNQADLAAIFGPEGTPQQMQRLIAMRSGNEQDYLFMLLYAAFLTSGIWALFRDLRLRMLVLALPIPLIAALFDGYENWLLFDIQAAFAVGGYSGSITSLAWPVWMKFGLLAACNLVIGQAMTTMSGWWKLFGTLVIFACVPVVMAWTAPMAFGWTLTAAISAGWAALLVAAALGSWQAVIRRKPLASFDPGDLPPLRPRRARAEPEEDVETAPTALGFGRRRAEDPGE
ncbi:MAG: hypothetical protein RLZZ58_1494 [Pseudomonadota bacterium]